MRMIAVLHLAALRLSQLAPVASAVALAVLLSGCVVYTGGWHHHPYWR